MMRHPLRGGYLHSVRPVPLVREQTMLSRNFVLIKTLEASPRNTRVDMTSHLSCSLFPQSETGQSTWATPDKQELLSIE